MKKTKYDANKKTPELPQTVIVRLEKIANGQPAVGEFELMGTLNTQTLKQSALECGYRVIDWSFV